MRWARASLIFISALAVILGLQYQYFLRQVYTQIQENVDTAVAHAIDDEISTIEQVKSSFLNETVRAVTDITKRSDNALHDIEVRADNTVSLLQERSDRLFEDIERKESLVDERQKQAVKYLEDALRNPFRLVNTTYGRTRGGLRLSEINIPENFLVLLGAATPYALEVEFLNQWQGVFSFAFTRSVGDPNADLDQMEPFRSTKLFNLRACT